MVSFVKGDVVILPFPFSDLSSTKSRPGLVLATPKDDEVIVCQITSKTSRPELTVKLLDTDFAQGGLKKKTSYIRPNQMFMCEPSIIKYKAGKIKNKKMRQVTRKAIKILKAH